MASHMLNVGEPAPAWSLPDQCGNPVALNDFRGKKNVIRHARWSIVMLLRVMRALVLGLLLCWSSGCTPVGGSGGPSNDNVVDNANDNGPDEGNSNASDVGNDNTAEPAPTLFTVSSRCGPCHNALVDEADKTPTVVATAEVTVE